MKLHATIPPEVRSAPAEVRRAAPGVDHDARRIISGIRRFERATGVYRPGRSPWVWVLGPGLNLVVTTGVTAWIGLASGLGWVATVPLAVFCGVAMGLMAWGFMGTSWDQEEDERRAAEILARKVIASPPVRIRSRVSEPDHDERHDERQYKATGPTQGNHEPLP